jgi:RNA-directed DNA polymerase
MSNPLRDGWGRLWGRLTGEGYYPVSSYILELDSETLGFVSEAWQYQGIGYQYTQELLNSNNLYPIFQYRHFKQRKDDGSFRELVEPEPALKNIQQRIVESYLKNAPVHRAAMGYRPKLSIANHVWAHVGAKIIITADIQDFFPTTHTHRIRDWWAKQFASQSAIELATILTTYRGGLPQGAPTSPALSNIVNFELDELLSHKIERSGGVYTRYVDDMVFSWQRNYRPPSDIRQSIAASLHEFGYELKAEKWHQYRAEDEPEITGLILRKHGKVTIPDAMRQKIRQLEQNEAESSRLAGYRGFQKMAEKAPRLQRNNPPRPIPQNYPQSTNDEEDYDDEDDYDEEDDAPF